MFLVPCWSTNKLLRVPVELSIKLSTDSINGFREKQPSVRQALLLSSISPSCCGTKSKARAAGVVSPSVIFSSRGLRVSLGEYVVNNTIMVAIATFLKWLQQKSCASERTQLRLNKPVYVRNLHTQLIRFGIKLQQSAFACDGLPLLLRQPQRCRA